VIKTWRDHWAELSTMFKYLEQIRRIIYTTNALENFNRQLREVTKTKSAFVRDDALIKQLYLITMQVTEKWTMPITGWGSILMCLMVYFGDRVEAAM
jgi:transposase-like protein